MKPRLCVEQHLLQRHLKACSNTYTFWYLWFLFVYKRNHFLLFPSLHTDSIKKQLTFKGEVINSLLTVVGWWPLTGPGAGCWLAGRCNDGGLAESRRLRAEVYEARACGGALLGWEYGENEMEKTIEPQGKNVINVPTCWVLVCWVICALFSLSNLK